MKKVFIALALMVACQSIIFSQKNSIEITGNDLLIEYLTEGTNRYLVYIENEAGTVLDASIWERTTSFSKIGDEDVIVIEQNWRNQDTTKSRVLYSTNKKENFSPIYHYTQSGKGVKSAFGFTEEAIAGVDTVAQNSKKDFHMALTAPTLNWELDMEVFRCLPYKKNTTFQINFYHPGSPRGPAFYNYEVIGEEQLAGVAGHKIDCWLLKINYNEKNHATFWIDKKSQEVLKMVEQFNNIKRRKIKFHS